MKRFVINRRGDAPLSPQRFARLRVLFWLYTLVWMAALAYITVASWIAFGWKIWITVLLVLGMPSFGDLRDPYADYRGKGEANRRDQLNRDEQDNG